MQALPDKVHYGCGMHVLDGWLNVDAFKSYYPWDAVAAPVKSRIRFVELTQRHPFPDASFRYGYAEDFLEHLDQAESLIFLAESFRTLREGGVLRLSFPGLAGVLRRHYRASDYEGAATGNQEAFVTWHHKHFFCLESLELVARHLGFRAVSQMPYGVSAHEALRALETRPDQQDLNLIVELTK